MILDKNKVFLIIDETGHNVEYTIEVPSDEDAYFMRRSTSSSWADTARGELILTVLNSGDGYRFKWEDSNKNKVLDYAQTIELNIMLNFLNNTSRMPNRYSVVDSDMIVDLV